MKKEALTAFNGIRLTCEAALKLKTASPELFKKASLAKLPGALFESVKKNNPKMPDETKAFLLYFTGNLVEYFSGEYAGPDADHDAAVGWAYEGLKAVDAAYEYLKDNRPELFSEEQAVLIPAAIHGFIDEMKYKISAGAKGFLEQFLGFVSFNLEKGFIQYDPAKKNSPRQMELF
jgi:hypothetical protein